MPQVVVETLFFDAQGKPITGPTLWSQFIGTHSYKGDLNGTLWNGHFKEAPDGKLTAIVPRGLENAELIPCPLQGFAWRKGKQG